MSPESPTGRAFIMKCLREMFAMIESTGVPRYVLMDVISSCMNEMASQPQSSTAHASDRGKHFEMRSGNFEPGTHGALAEKEMDRTMDAIGLLDPVLLEIMHKFDTAVALSALASQLARLLVDVKDQGAPGAAFASGVLDGLAKTVKSGRTHLTEILVTTEH